MQKLLITGGAGYVGRHLVKFLGKKGFEIMVYDNLITGFPDSLLYGELVVGDLRDEENMSLLLKRWQPDIVIHLASWSGVGESFDEPLEYYQNNVQGSLTLLTCMKKTGVRKLIFSSSASVYGEPEKAMVDEETELSPISPYGKSKVMVEKILEDMKLAGEISYLSLRYFNVAGADEEGLLGEERENDNHLITRCVRTALMKEKKISIFGTDYPTEDGTCVRDYIHVEDLARSHLPALNFLNEGGWGIFNCGSGQGYSVKEVIEMTSRVTGVDIGQEHKERRSGDPPVLVADISSIKEKLGWKPQEGCLERIISSAWNWEQKRMSFINP